MSDRAELEARSVALMRSLAAGHDRALAELIALWQEPVLRFVYRYLQSETEAREIVHETFLRVHAQRARFSSERAFRPWLFTVAGNLARSRRRWWRRHPSLAWLQKRDDEPHTETACAGLTPEKALERSERVAAVQAAIEALPHDWKTALLLHEYEGLAYREIAEVLACSERTVETKLSRAREQLRAALGRYLRREDASRVLRPHLANAASK